jgi:hypothetical protein
MNQLIRSRLSSIALILLIPALFVGCSQNCNICGLTCMVLGWGNYILVAACYYAFCPECLNPSALTAVSQFCEDTPDECAAAYEQMQTAAIQFCEEYPEECQDAFDTWAESLDTEAEE